MRDTVEGRVQIVHCSSPLHGWLNNFRDTTCVPHVSTRIVRLGTRPRVICHFQCLLPSPLGTPSLLTVRPGPRPCHDLPPSVSVQPRQYFTKDLLHGKVGFGLPISPQPFPFSSCLAGSSSVGERTTFLVLSSVSHSPTTPLHPSLG